LFGLAVVKEKNKSGRVACPRCYGERIFFIS
jgi:hypothetical protein